MKRILLGSLFVAAVSMLHAEDWSAKWEWPLVPENQKFVSGSSFATEMDAGSTGWPSTKRLEEPYKAARDGSNEVKADGKQAQDDASKTPVPASTAKG